jgi:tetratricopeptide (TPR) repeat protein
MKLRDLAVCTLLLAACSGRGAPVTTGGAGSVPMPVFETSSYALTLAPPEAPWSLTASDGSGLVMTRIEAKAVFQGPLAFTELHLYFHNPEDRVREGRFQIALPPRAAVSRFAMEDRGQWMEAEVVEKMAARRAYEDFLHRRQDPALLEKGAGNQFTARVFPIPARGDKHLVISFSQDLPGERYVLPLRGLPKVDQVDVRLSVTGADGRRSDQVLSERAWKPDRDFVSEAPVAAEAIAAGPLVAAQLAVTDPSGALPPADAPAGITLLVDTSASRSLGFGGTIRTTTLLVEALRKRYGDALPLSVLAFDQTTQAIFRGRAADWSKSHEGALAARGAAGASDLGQALAAAGAAGAHPRLVLLTDGVVTAGAGAAELAAAVKQLAGVERIDVLLAGGIRDDELAGTLARAAARPGAVLELERGIDDAVAALGERMLTDVAIEVPGAAWSYPKKLASARAGSRVMVYARLLAATQTLTAAVNGHRRSVSVVSGAPALVQRAVAATEIGELEAKLAGAPREAARALREEIARRAVAARVVSSQTSLLVLESDADYARFGIDRNALVDILEVAADGSLVQRHRAAQIATTPKQPPQAIARDRDKAGKLVKQDAAKDTEDLKNAPKKAFAAPREVATGRATGAKALEADIDDALLEGNASGGEALADVEEEKPMDRAPPKPEPPAPSMAPPPPPAPEPDSVAVEPRALRRVEAERAERRRAVRIPRNSNNNPLADEDEPVLEGMRAAPTREGRETWPPPGAPPALNGELAEIMRAPRSDAALAKARAWHLKDPGDVLALIGLGEVLEARGDLDAAGRMYGSIIDLFPGRADLRRFAGERLERIGDRARSLAIDTYRRAVQDRPDHATGHRLLAYALLRAGRHADAFAAIIAGLEQKYPDDRFLGVARVLAEDAGLIGAAYAAAAPGKRAEIAAALGKHRLAIAAAPSTRFVLYWETDANDVDFHIQDARGGHAWYSSKRLPSGGELYEDVTTGYGPECFAIPGTAKAGPYRLSINYYSQGPMGYGMGLLQIVRHDGKGTLSFEDRPYVIMNDHAYVDLGAYR